MRVFRAPQEEGKIRHVGLSEVSIEDIERAGSVVEIATVQNVYNVATRVHEDVLTYCERNNIASIPFWPLHGGSLASYEWMADIGKRENATPAQVALAWILKRSTSIVVIPGASSIAHLEQYVAACSLQLSDADMEILEHVAGSSIR